MVQSTFPSPGFSTTITFGTSAFTAELQSVAWSGYSRASIDTSHMGTTNGLMTFIPSDLIDPGSLAMEISFDPDKTVPLAQTDVAETVTVTFPKAGATTAAKWAASGFVTDFEFTDPMDDRMTASMTVKFSGAITFTASA